MTWSSPLFYSAQAKSELCVKTVFYINLFSLSHTNPEVMEMKKDEQEKLNRKKSNEMFNSITQKVKPENQNQTHNSRREGMGPNTKRKPG